MILLFIVLLLGFGIFCFYILAIDGSSDYTPITPANNSPPSHPITSPSVLSVRQKFLANNAHFADSIMNSILSSGNNKTPWLLECEHSEQDKVRTVFLGYKDIYCFIGEPTDYDVDRACAIPWPETYYIAAYNHRRIDYTYQRFTYADHFGFAPVSEYMGISKEIVLGWIAEEVHSRFCSLHPDMNVSTLQYSTKYQDCYYYFRYNAASKSLVGWK